jgi:hypothetical protein
VSIEKAVSEQVKKSVETTVRVQIAEALSANPEALVRAVVDEAMSEKQNSYSRQTKFHYAVSEMIRQAAKEEFKVWLDEHKALIRKAIQKRMKEEGSAFINTVADKIVEGVGSSFYVNARLKVEDE